MSFFLIFFFFLIVGTSKFIFILLQVWFVQIFLNGLVS